MAEEDWFKTGKSVAVLYGGGVVAIKRVDRMTPTQIVVEGEERYRKSDLHSVGTHGPFDYVPRIAPLDDEHVVRRLAEQRNSMALRKVTRLAGEFKDWPTLDNYNSLLNTVLAWRTLVFGKEDAEVAIDPETAQP